MPVENKEIFMTPFQKFVLVRICDAFLLVALTAFGYTAWKLVAGSLESAYHTNIFNFFLACMLVWAAIYFRPRNETLRRWSFRQWRKIEDWL